MDGISEDGKVVGKGGGIAPPIQMEMEMEMELTRIK